MADLWPATLLIVCNKGKIRKEPQKELLQAQHHLPNMACKQRDGEGKSDKEKETVPLYTYIGESEKSAHKRGGEHT